MIQINFFFLIFLVFCIRVEQCCSTSLSNVLFDDSMNASFGNYGGRGLNVRVFSETDIFFGYEYDLDGDNDRYLDLINMLDNSLWPGMFLAVSCYDSCHTYYTADLFTSFQSHGAEIDLSQSQYDLASYVFFTAIGTDEFTYEEVALAGSGGIIGPRVVHATEDCHDLTIEMESVGRDDIKHYSLKATSFDICSTSDTFVSTTQDGDCFEILFNDWKTGTWDGGNNGLRGLQLRVFDQDTLYERSYWDTHDEELFSNSMATILNNIEDGMFVSVACIDSCHQDYTDDLWSAFQRIGAQINIGETYDYHRASYVFFTQVGNDDYTYEEMVLANEGGIFGPRNVTVTKSDYSLFVEMESAGVSDGNSYMLKATVVKACDEPTTEPTTAPVSSSTLTAPGNTSDVLDTGSLSFWNGGILRTCSSYYLRWMLLELFFVYMLF